MPDWANVVLSALGARLEQEEQTDLIVLTSSGLGLPAGIDRLPLCDNNLDSGSL